MFKLFATGPQALIQRAQDILFDSDPALADAIDAKEETRTLWRLDAFCEFEDDALAARAALAEALPELSVALEAVVDRDWVALSLEGLPPVFAGPFVVAGSHALSALSPGRKAIVIEAGPAFGTGHHGTTLGCLLAFNRLNRQRRPGRVLDLGTGSGVLAIAAAKSGAHICIGTDIDGDSVRVATENAAKNAAQARTHMLHTTGARSPLVRRNAPFDTIFANILARPLVSLSGEIAALLSPGGHAILSGLLNHQEPLVRAAYAGHGLSLVHRIRRDGWSTLVYRKR